MRKQNTTSPLLPFVTLEQIMAFIPEDEETWTASPVVNAVCRAFAVLGIVQRQVLADYLQVDGQALSGALAIATGLPYHRLKASLQARYYHLYKAEEPDLTQTEMARRLGFFDASGLERFLVSDEYKDAVRDMDQTAAAYHAKERRRYFGTAENMVRFNKRWHRK